MYVAVPFVKVTGGPRVLAPSINCTEPVTPVGATVAVKVTCCPATEGLLLSASAVLLVCMADTLI